MFGYPVIHGSAELVVQEAMYAGVPPVVFAGTGAAALVTHGMTGLVVQTEDEYVSAIETLHRDEVERRRLGVAAAAYARVTFGAERTAARFETVYDRLMSHPKRSRIWPYDQLSARTYRVRVPFSIFSGRLPIRS